MSCRIETRDGVHRVIDNGAKVAALVTTDWRVATEYAAERTRREAARQRRQAKAEREYGPAAVRELAARRNGRF